MHLPSASACSSRTHQPQLVAAAVDSGVFRQGFEAGLATHLAPLVESPDTIHVAIGAVSTACAYASRAPPHVSAGRGPQTRPRCSFAAVQTYPDCLDRLVETQLFPSMVQSLAQWADIETSARIADVLRLALGGFSPRSCAALPRADSWLWTASTSSDPSPSDLGASSIAKMLASNEAVLDKLCAYVVGSKGKATAGLFVWLGEPAGC